MDKKIWNAILVSIFLLAVVFVLLLLFAGSTGPVVEAPELPSAVPAMIIHPEKVTVKPTADTWQLKPDLPNSGEQFEGVAFYKNGVFSHKVKFQSPHTLGSLCSASYSEELQSYYFQPFTTEIISWQDLLLDIKGDDTPRYIVLVNSDNKAENPDYEAYLIDTADDFAVLGRVPAGAVAEYQRVNPDLIFEFTEVISDDAQIKVLLKLRKNMPPELVSTERKLDISKLKEAFAAGKVDQNLRAKRLKALYCHLANTGNLRGARGIAKNLGYTSQEIFTHGGDVYEKIRKSPLYDCINQLNGNCIIK